MTGLFSKQDKANEVLHRIEAIADEAFDGKISAFMALAKILAQIRLYRSK